MGTKRTIVTDYQRGDVLVKRCSSKYADSAVMRCVGHLQTDEYGASYAIVYDFMRGHDIAVFARTPNKIEVLYKRKVRP